MRNCSGCAGGKCPSVRSSQLTTLQTKRTVHLHLRSNKTKLIKKFEDLTDSFADFLHRPGEFAFLVFENVFDNGFQGVLGLLCRIDLDFPLSDQPLELAVDLANIVFLQLVVEIVKEPPGEFLGLVDVLEVGVVDGFGGVFELDRLGGSAVFRVEEVLDRNAFFFTDFLEVMVVEEFLEVLLFELLLVLLLLAKLLLHLFQALFEHKLVVLFGPLVRKRLQESIHLLEDFLRTQLLQLDPLPELALENCGENWFFPERETLHLD